MKKALTLVVLMVTSTMAFAQGMVAFNNQTGLVRQWTSETDTTLIPVPKNGGYVQLFAAPIGTALPNLLFTAPSGPPRYDSLAAFLSANPGWTTPANANGAVPAPIALGAGLFSGGIYTINGIPAGGSAEYFVIGWTGPATDLTSALSAYAPPGSQTAMGESAIFTTLTADPYASPPATGINLRTTFGGMELWPRGPEPSMIALAGVGALMLMVFRRRR